MISTSGKFVAGYLTGVSFRWLTATAFASITFLGTASWIVSF
jgi:hypothetical protein